MLTDKACKSFQPQDKSYKKADCHGLYLEIMPSGSKYWRFRYRIHDKDKRMALGVYPEVSLVEARQKKDQARELLRNGCDPSEERKDKKLQTALNVANTFESIAREWHQHFLDRWSEGHAPTILRRLEMNVFPHLGNVPITNITTQRLLSVVQDIESRGAHEVARRILQICSHVFRYAAITGRAEHNPADNLKGVLKPYKKGHYAAIEAKDLPGLLYKLQNNEGRLLPHTQLAVEMMLLTFVRTGELIKAKWSEFDLENRLWVIPADRMKMRKNHMVPLSGRVLEILHHLKKHDDNFSYVFSNHSNPLKHMSNNTILGALRRMGYKGIMTGHGFRALAMSTIKEKLGYRHEVIDRQLAHAHKSDVDKAYDRAKFLDERTKMMQDWADYVEKLKGKK